MSRDEAYEAAIDELTDLVDRIETFYTTPMTDEAIAIRARAIVDAALVGAGIDPDKTYYTIDRRKAQELSESNNIYDLLCDGVLVPVGVELLVKEDTENES